MFSIFTVTSHFLKTVRLELWRTENICSVVIRSLTIRVPFIALRYRSLMVGSSPVSDETEDKICFYLVFSLLT